MSKITLGCDPEVMFMLKDRRPGKYSGMIPASFILNRTKAIIPDMINHIIKETPAIRSSAGDIFADGASWELNPKPGDVKEIIENIKSLLRTTSIIQNLCETEFITVKMDISPSIPLDINMLRVWGDPSLAEFGCDPDKSVHPREVNPSCINAPTHPFRYCGGHIHFGYAPEVFKEDGDFLYKFILLADATIGMLGIIMDEAVDSSAKQRRLVYGQPGVYRLQSHGIEYRTVSNSWMLTPERTRSMFTLATFVPTLQEELMDMVIDVQDVRRILITGDAIGAQHILQNLCNMLKWQEFTCMVKEGIEIANNPVDRWETEWGV